MPSVLEFQRTTCPNPLCSSTEFYAAQLSTWYRAELPDGLELNPDSITEALTLNNTTNPIIGQCLGCLMVYSKD